eukprot:970867-Amphidinium_carterae.1
MKGEGDLPSGAELRGLYGSLGVDAELLDVLCDEMRLLWDPREGKLIVKDGFMRKDDSVDVLSV